jgi:hypothetical protein
MENEMHDLQTLDAVARERNMLLAFRLCEDSDEVEPVFAEVRQADVGTGAGAVLFALSDRAGFSLGRYVVSRERLEAALCEAGGTEEAEPTLVPAEWQA